MESVKKIRNLAIMALCLSTLSGCATQYTYDSSDYYTNDNWDINQSILNGDAFEENKELYKADDDGKISCLYYNHPHGKKR